MLSLNRCVASLYRSRTLVFLLFAATIIAMVLANSPWADRYHQLLAFPIDLQAGQFNFFRASWRDHVYAGFRERRPYGGFLFS